MTDKKTEDIDDVFKDENKPQSNWFAFKTVGDKIAGVVTDIFDKAGEGDFPDQKVFVLKDKNGEETNVGIKKTSSYLITRTKKVRPGDKLGFIFKAEIPPKIKGHNPAKSIEPYVEYTPAGDEYRKGEDALDLNKAF